MKIEYDLAKYSSDYQKIEEMLPQIRTPRYANDALGFMINSKLNKTILSTLIEKKADLNNFQGPLLHKLHEFNSLDCIELILEQKVDPNAKYFKKTILESECIKENVNLDLIKSLAMHGASTEPLLERDIVNQSVIEVLLNNGADPSTCNSKGENLLHLALNKIDIPTEFISFLVEKKVDPLHKDKQNNLAISNLKKINASIARTLLKSTKEEEITKILLDLLCQTENPSLDLFEPFFENNIDFNTQKSKGISYSLFFYQKIGDAIVRKKFIDLIIDSGFNVNKTLHNKTLLQIECAFENCSSDIVTTLLDKKADPNQRHSKEKL